MRVSINFIIVLTPILIRLNQFLEATNLWWLIRITKKSKKLKTTLPPAQAVRMSAKAWSVRKHGPLGWSVAYYYVPGSFEHF